MGGEAMSGAQHGRKSPGNGGVRKVYLDTGEARYRVYVRRKYHGTYESRVDAEKAERKARGDDTTAVEDENVVR